MKPNKTDKFGRTKEQLLNDLFTLLHLRDNFTKIHIGTLRRIISEDILPFWTCHKEINEHIINCKHLGCDFWTKRALEKLYDPKSSIKLNHDHIVSKVWFEDRLIKLHEDPKISQIPFDNLEVLMNKFAIGVVCSSDENQRFNNLYKGNSRMPFEFTSSKGDYYLNPWIKYILNDIEVYRVYWQWHGSKSKTAKLKRVEDEPIDYKEFQHTIKERHAIEFFWYKR
ncbi:hypothetical protein [Paenibacillus amylolyticus]|uniref:hypothetical protein n=1 Tax=Paenibacillus amylolyticus TaxID=1451 RepID=UPI003D8056B5